MDPAKNIQASGANPGDAPLEPRVLASCAICGRVLVMAPESPKVCPACRGRERFLFGSASRGDTPRTPRPEPETG